jgi:hypothetical protein
MKRAQVEIIGLLIIVVLISMILLFAMKYYFHDESSYVPEFTPKDLSSSWIGAMLGTNSECTDDTVMSKVLIDCVKYPPEGSSELVCKGGKKSCEFAEEVLQEMLDKTLGEWKQPYEFIILSPSKQVVMDLKSDNLGDRQSTAFPQPLPLDTSGYQTMQVILCIGGKCEGI